MTNIVMLFHSRYALAQQALKSLRINTNPSQYNLTIVYDLPQNPDFRLSDLLEMHAFGSNTTMLKVYNSGHVLSQLKNMGVYASEQTFGRGGDYLYLSDSDVYFTPGWLEILEHASKTNPEFGLIGGQCHPFHGNSSNAALAVMGNGYAVGQRDVLDGPSWHMKWGVWDSCGPLLRTTAPGVCQSEDAEFCAKIVAYGLKLGTLRPSIVVHTGLTNSDGKDAPGRAEREDELRRNFPTIIYK